MKNNLKIIGISLAIHLLFSNIVLFSLMSWACIGLFFGYIEINSGILKRSYKFEKFFLMFLACIMGPLVVIVVDDWKRFNENSPIKFPKIRNPFYYED